jgi:hypothetical protein
VSDEWRVEVERGPAGGGGASGEWRGNQQLTFGRFQPFWKIHYALLYIFSKMKYNNLKGKIFPPFSFNLFHSPSLSRAHFWNNWKLLLAEPQQCWREASGTLFFQQRSAGPPFLYHR